MSTITRLAVYCGSAPGGDVRFADVARATGEAMAARGIDLVYGGGKLGLMGIVADTVIAGGGRTYGVIPEALVVLELDELFEAWSWNALGYHAKPFCLVDVGGFWAKMTDFLDHAAACGFLSPARRAQLLVAATPEEAIEKLDEAAKTASQAMVW